MGLIYRSIC